MPIAVGTRVATGAGNARLLGIVAFDNGDSTYDLILDNGDDLDGVHSDLVDSSPSGEELQASDAAEEERRVQSTAKQPGALRFVAVSDTHGLHRQMNPLPDGDVLLHMGDFSNTGEHQQVQDFHDWMAEQPHRLKIAIAGNHDTTMDADYYTQAGGGADRYAEV